MIFERGKALTSLSDARLVSLFLLLSYPQAQYFQFYFGRAFLLFGLSFFSVAICVKRSFFSFRSDQWLFCYLLLFSFLLTMLLSIFGEGDEGRSLVAAFLVQIALFFLVADLLKSSWGRECVAQIFLAVILVEFFIVFLQFTYLTYGFGLLPASRDDVFLGVTGSQANPNNTATFVGVMSIAVSLYSLYSRKYKTLLVVLVLSSVLSWLALSRTVLILVCMNVIFCAWYYMRQSQRGSFLGFISRASTLVFIVAISAIIFFISVVGTENDVVERSLERAVSLLSIEEDQSVGFRFVVLQRFFESIPLLGLGTFEDLSYQVFFYPEDPSLMSINPHSLIVEFSFLFGYVGLFVVVSLFSLLVYLIMFKTSLPVFLKVFVCFSLLLSQAVPSSLLAQVYYYLPFVFIVNAFYKDFSVSQYSYS